MYYIKYFVYDFGFIQKKNERLEKWKYTQDYEPLLIICRGGILTVSN